jgi:tetratricopeptide (TPR) repeat protein
VALPAPPAAPPPIGATPFGEEIIIVDEGESSEETVFGPPPDLAPSVASPVPSASPPAPVEEEEEIETLDIDELIEEVPDEEAAASGREEVDLGLDDKTRVAPPVAEVGRGEVRPRTDDEVASELEEAEFFQHQGLLEEARIILGELARARPGREDIAAKLREVETGLAVAGAAEAPAAPPPVEGAQAIVLDEMFEELSPQAELPPTLEDCETHYDLGIAYKEMGLIDDAIAEFRLAMRSPVRELSAMERIGTCYLEKKRFEDAVRELKRGLASSRITEVAAVDFYFGLGLAYEGLGDDREALYYFRRVAAANAAYRDVQQRIERLSQGASRSGGEAAATALRRKG